MDLLQELAREWRKRAADVRAWAAADGAACAIELCADELETAFQAAEDELLGPGAASEASNYSTRRLRELEAEGRLTNYGRRGAPRYRRGDLPRKPRAKGRGGYDVDADADGLIGRMAEGP